jgi:hypothetical protein
VEAVTAVAGKAGDYLRGGFFLSDLSARGKVPTLNFFMPWNESLPGATPNALFHAKACTDPKLPYRCTICPHVPPFCTTAGVCNKECGGNIPH